MVSKKLVAEEKQGFGQGGQATFVSVLHLGTVITQTKTTCPHMGTGECTAVTRVSFRKDYQRKEAGSRLPRDFLITGLGGQVSELKGGDGGGVETCVKMLLKPHCSR